MSDMTTKGDFYLPHKVWNARAERLLQHMIFSMDKDYQGKKPRPDACNPKTLGDIAKEDLGNFLNWQIFIRATKCNMNFPNRSQIEQYLKRGRVKKQGAPYMVTNKADKVRK